MEVAKVISIFFVAAFFEIGGGYLIWIWVKEDKPIWYALLGGFVLVLYGLVATFQTAVFTKVYAAYGGFFIVASFIWGFKMEQYVPDKYDVIGLVLIVLGVLIIYFGKD